MYIKRFLEWIGLKERLELMISRAPFVNEGEIWWASIGENVGFEISGKGDKFVRPVIVLRKFKHDYFFVIPATSRVLSGNWFVNFKIRGKKQTACLHQARALDFRRLDSKLGELDELDFNKVKEGFKNLYIQQR
jgi:mRNA interferase MazF